MSVSLGFSYELNQSETHSTNQLLQQLQGIRYYNRPFANLDDILTRLYYLGDGVFINSYHGPNSIQFEIRSFTVEAQECIDSLTSSPVNAKDDDSDEGGSQNASKEREKRGSDDSNRGGGRDEGNTGRSNGDDNQNDEGRRKYSGEDGDDSDSDNNDEGGGGYSGSGEDSDGEDSVNNKDKLRHRKHKKSHLQLGRARYIHRPISLVRGLKPNDKLPQEETSSAQRSITVFVVAGASAYTLSSGRTCLIEQHCNEQVHQLSTNRQNVLQLLLLYHQILVRRVQKDVANASAINVNSLPVCANSHFPIEETSHQLVSATVHGSVLIQPCVFNFSPVFSNAVVDGILNLLSLTCPNVPSSCTTDSGLGTSPPTAQSHFSPQNEHCPYGTLATIPTQRKRDRLSNDPNWDLHRCKI